MDGPARLALFVLVTAAMLPILAHSQSVKGGDWASLLLNYNDTRYQPNSTVNASNIGSLVQDWQIATGTVTTTPLVVNGNVFFDDWNGWVYDANILTGSTAYPNWRVNLGGNSISATPLVYNGTVYVGLGPDDPQQPTVYALSQADGHVIWETMLPTSSNELYASPIVFNGLLYIGVAGDIHDQETNANSIGAVYALNAANGNVIWTRNTSIGGEGGSGVWGTVVVDPGLDSIYFGTSNPYVDVPGSNSLYGYAVMSLNATNGKINWYYQIYKNLTSGFDDDFGSSANLFNVQIGGTIYPAVGIGNKDGRYYVLDRTDGKMLENFSIAWPNPPEGIRGNRRVHLSPGHSVNPEIFVSASYTNTSMPGITGVAEAFYTSNGAAAWRFYTPGVPTGSVSIVPGAVLFGDSSSNFYALNVTNGNVLFYRNFNSSILAGITPAEGHILVPLAGVKIGVPQGIYAFSPSSNAIAVTSTTTIPVSTPPGGTSSYISLTASNTVADAGQIITLTVRTANSSTSNSSVQVQTGHSQYTFYFVSGQTGLPAAVIYDVNGQPCSNIEGLVAATCTFKESIGDFLYGAGARSSGATINSSAVGVNVYGDVNNSNGNVPTVMITPNDTAPSPNGMVVFEVKVGGGVGPFRVQLYNTTGTGPVGNPVMVNSPGDSSAVQVNMSANPGNYFFSAIATDEGTTSPFSFNSVRVELRIGTSGSGNAPIEPQNIYLIVAVVVAVVIAAAIAVLAYRMGIKKGRRTRKIS